MKEITYTVKVDANGNKRWYVNGKCHREDGPAIEWDSGGKAWYVKGKLHREDGPAVEWADGSKEWYVAGKCHREDGPACEWANGTKEWYVNGKSLTKQEFNERKKSKKSSCAGKVAKKKVQELEIFLRFVRILAKPLRYGKQRANKGETRWKTRTRRVRDRNQTMRWMLPWKRLKPKSPF